MSQNFNGNDDNVIDIDTEKLKKRATSIIPIVIGVIVIVSVLINSIFTIDTKEQGVILRLGKLYKVEEQAGLHLKVPFIDEVRKVNVGKLYNMEYGFRVIEEGTETTKAVYQDVPEEANVIVDGANNNASIAIIELIIQYKVNDAFNFLYKVDDVEGTLRLALEDVVRSKVQAFTLEQAITQKELIDQEILPALQKKLENYSTGLKITKVSTQNVQFLPSVGEAYQQKENANQYKNGKIEDGEKYENTIVPQAQAEARAIVEEANAYAATVKAAAKADVAQFLALYDEYESSDDNKAILRERYYLDAMKEFIANNEIVIDFSESDSLLKLFNMQEGN